MRDSADLRYEPVPTDRRPLQSSAFRPNAAAVLDSLLALLSSTMPTLWTREAL